MSDVSQGDGWWQASDEKWYPPESAPAFVAGTGSSWKDKARKAATAAAERGKAEALKAKQKAEAAKEERRTGGASQPTFTTGNQQATESTPESDGLILRVTSHDSGRNAIVSVYADRIERVKERSFNSLSRAQQNAEVIPIRAISSVETKKDGLMYTKVIAYASGNTIVFRVAHAEAPKLRTVLTDLVLDLHKPAPAAPVLSHADDKFDRLAKLGQLRDSGVLSEQEFEEQKAKILAE